MSMKRSKFRDTVPEISGHEGAVNDAPHDPRVHDPQLCLQEINAVLAKHGPKQTYLSLAGALAMIVTTPGFSPRERHKITSTISQTMKLADKF